MSLLLLCITGNDHNLYSPKQISVERTLNVSMSHYLLNAVFHSKRFYVTVKENKQQTSESEAKGMKILHFKISRRSQCFIHAKYSEF